MAIEITQTDEFLDIHFKSPEIETLKLHSGIRIYEIGEFTRFDYSYIIAAGMRRVLATIQYLAPTENSEQVLNGLLLGTNSKDITYYLRPDTAYKIRTANQPKDDVTYEKLKYAEYSPDYLIADDPRIGRPILANKILPPFYSYNKSLAYEGHNPFTGTYEQTIINPISPQIFPSSFN